MPTDEIEKILEPKRMVRIFGSVFLVIVLFFALVVGSRMAANTMNSVEVTSHDHAWFKAQTEEIKALQARIAETRLALASHKKEVGSRWVSRSDDRAQTQKLTQSLISMQEELSSLVSGYNVAADAASDSILEGLPKSITLEKPEKSDAAAE